MSAPLYEIVAQYRELTALEDSADLPPEVIRDTLDALTGTLQDKAIAVGQFIGNLEASAVAIEEQAKRMQERAYRIRKRAESVRAYLEFNMQNAGISKIECEWFTLRLKLNPPRVCVTEPALIPGDYMRAPVPQPLEIDKKKILEAHKRGVPVPGTYIEQAERLEIKT